MPCLSLAPVWLSPEALQRTIYDAFHLEVHYHRPRREIQLQVTVPEVTARELGALTARVLAPAANRYGSDQPSFECPRRGTQQKDDASDLRPLAGRLIIKGSFEPLKQKGAV